MMNQMKMARPTPWRCWPRCVPWPPPLDLSTYPTCRTYHTRGRPIAIAPSDNSVDKHKGWDNTCVAAKATPPFFNATAGVKKLGKGRGWQQNEDAGLCYPPPRMKQRIPLLSSSFTHSELIHTTAPRQSSENPTAVFAVPTLWAHLHRTQMKTVIIPLPSLLCPHLAASLVTLAAQSSVIPTTVLLHPLPTTARLRPTPQQEVASYPVPLITMPICFTYTILQPPSCNSCRTLPLPLLSKCH